MIAIDPFRPQIEAEVGPIRAVSAITKGFSFEKKLKLTSDRGDFLARCGMTSTCQNLPKQLHATSVD